MATSGISRREQRKAETRRALLGAAQVLLAERRTEASIREITALAGVGFGSFFNYFDSKEDLYDAAFLRSVSSFAGTVNRLCRDIEDPAEAVSAALRLVGRLQRVMGLDFKVMLSRGTMVALHDSGMSESFRERLKQGNRAGCFEADDLDRTDLAISGAVLGFVQLLDLHPEMDAARESDEFTWRALLTIGVERQEAERLVGLPLPGLPEGDAPGR